MMDPYSQAAAHTFHVYLIPRVSEIPRNCMSNQPLPLAAGPTYHIIIYMPLKLLAFYPQTQLLLLLEYNTHFDEKMGSSHSECYYSMAVVKSLNAKISFCTPI